MNLLLLDYWRRMRWIWLLGAFIGVLIGIGLLFAHGHSPSERRIGLGALLQIAFFIGALPLSIELRNGAGRVTACMPIRSREIGRALWIAGVAVPTALLTLPSVLANAGCQLLGAAPLLPWSTCGLHVLATCLWLGSAFQLLMRMSNRPRQATGFTQVRQVFSSLTWGLMASGGFTIPRWSANYPGVEAALLVTGAALTLDGWWRAGELVAARSAVRPTGHSGGTQLDSPRSASGQIRGGGGLRYLIAVNVARTTGLALGIMALTPLFMRFQGMDWSVALRSITQASQTLAFIMLISVAQLLLQLRHLRTLPVSSSRLAGTILLIVAGPGIALAAIHVFLSGLLPDFYPTLAGAQNQLLAGFLFSLIIALALWHGLRRSTYYLCFAIVIASPALSGLAVFFGPRSTPSPWLIASSLILTPLAAFLIIRHALQGRGPLYRNADKNFGHRWSMQGNR